MKLRQWPLVVLSRAVVAVAGRLLNSPLALAAGHLAVVKCSVL
jgi:hypothetical protein